MLVGAASVPVNQWWDSGTKSVRGVGFRIPSHKGHYKHGQETSRQEQVGSHPGVSRTKSRCFADRDHRRPGQKRIRVSTSLVGKIKYELKQGAEPTTKRKPKKRAPASPDGGSRGNSSACGCSAGRSVLRERFPGIALGDRGPVSAGESVPVPPAGPGSRSVRGRSRGAGWPRASARWTVPPASSTAANRVGTILQSPPAVAI